MIIATLPNGYRVSWIGDSARISLPPFELVDGKAYEPVLTQKDVERIADALDIHAEKRRRAGVDEPLRHVQLTRDSRYRRDSLAKFREQLSFGLVERGYDVAVDDRTTTTAFVTA